MTKEMAARIFGAMIISYALGWLKGANFASRCITRYGKRRVYR